MLLSQVCRGRKVFNHFVVVLIKSLVLDQIAHNGECYVARYAEDPLGRFQFPADSINHSCSPAQTAGGWHWFWGAADHHHASWERYASLDSSAFFSVKLCVQQCLVPHSTLAVHQMQTFVHVWFLMNYSDYPLNVSFFSVLL